ncbi:hypothetical protein PCAR4_60168 [Paraburkholderia caribensis]|nr:hypothetical protein PCAR4_60168 [Paraburkholderia caribensis]
MCRESAPTRHRAGTAQRSFVRFPLRIYPYFSGGHSQRRERLGRTRTAGIEHTSNRTDDTDVSGAAAQIAGEFEAHACVVGIGDTRDDVARGHQHAWRAVTALQCVLGGERGTQFVHGRVVVEVFDGAHRTARATDRGRDAGACGRAVHVDRARAAHALLAANVRAAQHALFAQKIREAGARLDAVRDASLVDDEFDRLRECVAHDLVPS